MNTPVVWSIAIKAKCIDLGLYKPARWLFDNIIDQKKRQLQRTRVNLFRSIIRPGDLCFDIGANKGDYTSALLEAGARVVAVEPQPSCIRELSARFNGNNRVCVIPTALGADCGTETFYVRKISGHSGLVKDWIGTDVVSERQVPVSTLEHLIAQHGRPKYIKIDVEGYEPAVLAGLNSRVEMISMEYHLIDEDVAQKMAIIDHLATIGSLSFNLLVDGSNAFQWPDFVDQAIFAQTFPRKLTQDPSLGDIFIAMR